MFVWEHRILPAPGVVRWVLARGYYERGPSGGMLGRGIVIDVTDSRIDGQFEGPARFLAAYEASGALLERMAELALELFDMARALDTGEAGRLRTPLEALLYELGRQIAASLGEGTLALERQPGVKVH
ncbi:diguanylate cyclase (plasmid) [Methylobacterium sp. NMS12]|uniref:diguanylate cyclase n=1 Tax=Methylobacterium sp. NMS12 TaxID=3079766 RepID=UPI003F881BD6